MANTKQTGLSVLLSLNTKEFSKGIKGATAQLDKLGRNVASLGSSIARSIGAPIAAATALATKSIVDFEYALAKVQAVGGFTSEELGKLKKQALSLGASTSKSASEVASLQLELAKLGKTQVEIENMTESVLSLSIAFDQELGESARVVGATLNQFNLDSSQTARVTDIMSKAFGSSALDLEKFDTAMRTVGPTANALGLSLEETTSALGVLVSSGVDASTAGTALNKAFVVLAQKGIKGGDALDYLFNGTLSVEEAYELFGDRAGKIIPILQSNGAQFRQLTTDLEGSEGATAKARATLEDTAKGALDKMKSALEALALSLSDVIIPKVKQFATIVSNLANKFASLDAETKKQVVSWAAFATGLGPALMITGKLISLSSTLLGVLAGISAPVLAIAAAIAAAVALIYTHWDELVVYFTEGEGAEVFSTLKTSVESVLGAIYTFIGTFVGLVMVVWDRWGDDILESIRFSFQNVAEVVSTALEMIGNVFNIFSALFQGDWGALWDNLKNFFVGIVKILVLTFAKFGNTVLKIWDGIFGTEMASDFETFTSDLVDSLDDQKVALDETEGSAFDLSSTLDGLTSAWRNLTRASSGGIPPLTPSDGGDGQGDGNNDEAGDGGSDGGTKGEGISIGLDVNGFKKSAEEMLSTTKGIGQQMTNIFMDAASEIGDVLGSAINSVSDILAGMITQTVDAKEAFRELGMAVLKQILSIAIANLIAAALSPLDPANAATGGTVGVTKAAAAPAIVGALFPKFAEGGAVLAPTLALVGEKAGSRGEAIIPFEKMTDFARKAIDQDALGGGNNVVVTGRISGSDIVLSNARGGRSRARF